MSIRRSFVKTEKKLEKEQAVIQAVGKTSTENNEQESSDLGTLDYEAVV